VPCCIKCLLIFKNTAAIDMLLLKFKVTWSVSLIHWSVVLWRARKPNWLALSRTLSSLCLWTVFRINFSNSLPAVNKRLIGRKFRGNFGSLPGFDNVMTPASFQDFGKWDNRRQCLNKCVRYTRGLLWRCLRHSFGIPQSPEAFLSFNDRCDQSLDSSLRPSFMDFITQAMRCKLVF
jgi:hypothetical protein